MMKKKLVSLILVAMILTSVITVAAFAGYTVSVGQGATYEKGSGKYYTVGAQCAYENYTGIMVDGVALNAFAFKDSAGFARIDLSPNYMNSLSNGNHTAIIRFANGDSDPILFTVKEGTYNPYGNPATGDESNSELWAALLLVSGVSAAAAVFAVRTKMEH